MRSPPPLDIAILNAVHDSAESLEIISGMTERPSGEVRPVLCQLWQMGHIAPDAGDAAYSPDASVDDRWFLITKKGRDYFDSVADRYWNE